MDHSDDVEIWLSRCPNQSVSCVLYTRPNGIRWSVERDILLELSRVLRDGGALWVWGEVRTLERDGWETSHVHSDLWLCGRCYVPHRDQAVRWPGGPEVYSDEMPPVWIEYAIMSTTRPGNIVIDLFPHNSVSEIVCARTNRRVLRVHPVRNQPRPVPSGGWPGRPELTDLKFRLKFFSGLRPAEGGCLLFRTVNRKTGYGQITIGGKTRLAHRVALELEQGPIHEGKVVAHSCPNHACCNPCHLRATGTPPNLQERDVVNRGKRW